ncbi:MAG: hypothetical protein L0228_16720, partial [Planctomycetes bacterium]|nr:hypothetical protein [Planctomycetota bacterium]
MASMASIVAMRRIYHDETLPQLVDFSIQHYTQRLAQLLKLAETINDRSRCLLLTHQQMLGETASTFRALEKFLALRAPLREDYKVTPTTGQPGVGDPTSSIRIGRIDRSLPRKHIELSAELHAQVQQCYETCLQKLGKMMPTPNSQSLAASTRAA